MHRSRRSGRRSTIALLILMVATPLAGQSGPGAYRTLAAAVEDARTRGQALPAPLATRVSVSFRAEPLARVLDDLARRADIGIAYADDIDRAPRVTLRADQVSVADVLLRATRGSGFTVWTDSAGQVVVRRDTRDTRELGPAATPTGERAMVRVSGAVRRRDSREVIRHATIIALRDDTVRVQANADGVYFLRLPAGRSRLVVRALGFAPLDTVLDLAGPATVDFLLQTAPVTLAGTNVVAARDRSDIDPQAPEMSMARLDLATVKKAPAVLGEVDPIRSLSLLPGVSRISDFTTAFSVRGGSGDQNLILLDEATIYNPAHVLGFLSVFNSDAVDDITLYKGAIPARYGGRLSSVLDVRQREGNANELAGTASIGLLASRASIEGPLPGHIGAFLVAARRSYADLFLDAARDTSLHDISAYFYDLNAKATAKIGSTGTLTASGYAGRDAFRPNDDFGASWGNVSWTLRWNQAVANRLFTKVTLYGSDYDYALHFKVLEDSARWTSRLRNTSLRVDEALSLDARNTIEFGIEGSVARTRPGDLRATDTAAVSPIRIEARHGVAAAAYVAHDVSFGPRFGLRYGGRFSTFARRGPGTVYEYEGGAPVHWNAALSRYESAPVIDSTTYRSGQTIAHVSGFEPRVSARFGLTPSASIKASFARTRQDLLLASRTNAPTPLDVWEPMGRHLEPQRADQVALGYETLVGGGAYEVSIEGYAKRLFRVPDFIDGTDVVLNPRVETAIVQGRGRARGIELFARKRTGTTTGWVSYTLGRAEQRFAEPFGGGINGGDWFPAPADKTHDLSIVAVRPLRGTWSIGATFNAASGLPATLPLSRYELDGFVVPEYGPRNSARLPMYHRLDLALTRTTRHGELQLGVYNAYNRFNAQSISFRQTARDPRATEAVELSIFGIVPSITYTRHF